MNTVTQTAQAQTKEDIKNSVLIVSGMINLFVFITWLVVEASPDVSVALVSAL